MDVNGRERTISIAIEIFTLLLIAFPVLAFGGNSELLRAVTALGGIVLAALVLYRRLTAERVRPVTRRKLTYAEPWPALILLGVFALVHVTQLVPLPAPLVRLLAGWPAEGGWARLTPDPETTLRALLGWVAPVAVFAAVTLIYDTRAAVRRLVGFILLLACFDAIYGLVEVVSGNEAIWDLSKSAYRGSVTGTFINRNHFAAFMALGLGAALGLGYYRRLKLGAKIRQEGGLERLTLIAFAAVICLLGVLLSKSRGGLGSLVLAGFPVVLWLVGRKRRLVFTLLIVALLIATVLMNLWIGREPVTGRFLELPEQVQAVDARPAAWAAGLRVFARAPLLGAGAGTFEDQIRITPNTDLLVRYNHAHCDPLEVLVENGVIGFVAFFGAIFWLLYAAARALADRRSRFARALTIGALSAVIAVLFHSLFDFPLQIPGVRVPLFAMLGVAYLVAQRRLTR